MPSRFIRWFREIGIADVALVGGKNASLGEMYRELTPQGIRIPNGFAVTAEAYRHFLEAGELGRAASARILQGLDTRDLADLAERGRQLREAILATPAARRSPAGDRPGLRRAVPRVRPGDRHRGPLQRHRRGPADRQLRRPAGVVPQRPRRAGPAGRLPPVLRLAVHRPGHLLPRGQGLRPLRRRPVDRRAEDGPLRPRRRRRAVHARHRERLPRRGADQQRLRPGRERRQGPRRSRRVPGLQADAQAGLPADPQAGRRRQAGEARSTPPAAAAARAASRCRRRIACGSASPTTTC